MNESVEEPLASTRATKVSWIQGWVDLHVRPEAFFSGQGRYLPMWLPICVVGMAGVMDRLEFALLRSSRSLSIEQLDWIWYWTSVLLGGAIAGPIGWLVGGWWVRVRARWCGAQGPSRDLCRRISVLSSCVASVPMVVAMAICTAVYESPVIYSKESDLFAVSLLGSLGWSVYVSYCAAVDLMSLRRRAALFWFAGLPAVTYALIIGGAAAYYVAL